MGDIIINNWQILIVLICTLNPVLAATLYSHISKSINLPYKLYLVFSTSFTLFILLATCAIYGGVILKFLGIHFYIIQLGGGLLILIVGIFNLLGYEHFGEMRYYLQKVLTWLPISKDEKITSNTNILLFDYNPKRKLSLGIIPLAIPTLFNPSSILVTLFFGQQAKVTNNINSLLIIIGVSSILLMLLLLITIHYKKSLSTITLLIAHRVSGLFLTIVALEMFINGVKAIIPYLLT